MRSFVRVSAALALVVALTACGDGTGPKQRMDDASLAAVVALPLAAGALQAPVGGTLPAPKCAYSESSGRFDCEPVASRGLTITRSYAFLDASGRPQRRFDPMLTASINTRMHVEGSIASDGFSLSMDRRSDITVSGLEGAETKQTINGVESGTTEAHSTGPFGSVRSTSTTNDTTLGLVVPIPPRPAPGERPQPVWPLAGKRIGNMKGTISLDGDAPSPISMRQVVTYSGTSTVTIELTVDGGPTRSCTVDLASPGFSECLLPPAPLPL